MPLYLTDEQNAAYEKDGYIVIGEQQLTHHALLSSALRPLPSALCPLDAPSALCSLPSALCFLLSALCSLLSAICHLPRA
jgi:hypothetical protein